MGINRQYFNSRSRNGFLENSILPRNKRKIVDDQSSVLIFFGEWLSCLAAGGAALAIGSDMLIRDGSPTPAGIVAACMIIVAATRYFWGHLQAQTGKSPAREIEGPLLLIVFAWALFRLGAPAFYHLLILPAGTLAWIVTRYPGWIAAICFLAGLAIETGLVMTGNQPLGSAAINILVCATAATALHFLPISGLYRKILQQERTENGKEADSQEQAAELGLQADTLIGEGILQDDVAVDHSASFSRQTVEKINASFEMQLEMIRQALELNTVAVLWPSPSGDELRLRYLATSRQDIDPGPYQVGVGITGALSGDRQEAELVGVRASHPALPYYLDREGVGAALIQRIPPERSEDNTSEMQKNGILCADRKSDLPWNDRERQVLKMAAAKLGLEIANSRMLLNMDRERSTVHRLYLGLRELNSGLGLESIFAASIKAVKTQVPTETVALCLRDEDHYQVVGAEGPGTEKLVGQTFPIDEGLVGQAFKTGLTLPAGGRYLGAAPVFANDQPCKDYGSLLVTPVTTEDNSPLACLVVATEEPGIFTRSRQEILELIAAQVAIKIELGQAHEKLGMMATTDGLTGLANHRAFQHGYDIMLDRAKRTGTPLCLLMGDLDHFKNINDRYGHPYGDHVLQKVSAVLADTVRTVDLAARYGGEEFALVLENCDAEGGHMLAERIREKIQQLGLVCGDQPLTVTISTGIAVFPDNGTAKELLVDRADRALYQAKNDGRNQTVVWSEKIG
jgi:diguanylate cyclase (GGDEF)-like protein